MDAVVYYFSGTGNSLAVARDLANHLQGTMVPMSSILNKKTTLTYSDTIGLVFPSYMAQLYGVPLIVEKFVRSLDHIESRYIFAVCTCGGYTNFNGLPALRTLSRIVKSLGGKVSAEYSIRLPMNTLDYSHIPLPINQDREKMFQSCDRKVIQICEVVARRAKSKFKLIKSILNIIMMPLYLMLRPVYCKELIKLSKEPVDTTKKFSDLFPLTDRSIYEDSKCRGCATCAKVCPVGNITMINGKPTWQNHCEICLACVEWCPNNAIHHGYRIEGKKYHHPDVTLADMIEQAKS